MGLTIQCDLCNQEVTNSKYISVNAPSKFVRGYYCEKCWLGQKNWPRIHGLRKKAS